MVRLKGGVAAIAVRHYFMIIILMFECMYMYTVGTYV